MDQVSFHTEKALRCMKYWAVILIFIPSFPGNIYSPIINKILGLLPETNQLGISTNSRVKIIRFYSNIKV